MPRIPASLESLDVVARYIGSLAERAGLTPATAYRLRLAADELVTNVITHGYRGREGELHLEGGVDRDTVWVRFEDDAPPFDPRAGLRPPEWKVPVAERRIGGLGVFLALTALDGFTYELVSGRNRSTLLVRRHDRAGEAG
ncbi:ATP-binding protein [Planomonospora algeriensis]